MSSYPYTPLPSVPSPLLGHPPQEQLDEAQDESHALRASKATVEHSLRQSLQVLSEISVPHPTLPLQHPNPTPTVPHPTLPLQHPSPTPLYSTLPLQYPTLPYPCSTLALPYPYPCTTLP